MRKLIIFILLAIYSIAVNAQNSYELKFDSVVVGKNNSSKFRINGRVWMPHLTSGLSTDSVLVFRNNRVFKVPRSQFSSDGTAALSGSSTFNSSTGYGTSNTYSLGTTLADTLYSVFVQVRESTSGSGAYIIPLRVSRSTTSFSVMMQAGSGSPTGILNWLVLPTGWSGLGGGGGGSYTLPTASASVLGGVKIGTGLNMAGDVLSTTGGANPDTTIYRTTANSLTKAQTQTALNTKQATLVSGTTIKTVNGSSLLGSGNITISGGGTTGFNSGDLVARITNGIAWDSGANNYITADPTSRDFILYAGTSSFGGYDFRTSSGQTRLYIAANGEIELPHYASGTTAPTTTGTKHMLTVDGAGLVSHEAIPSGGGGGTTNLALGTATTTTQPITNSNGTGFTLPASTTSVAGLLSATDKTKLDGIASGANNYSLPVATSSVLGGVKQGSGITIDGSGVISAAGGTQDLQSVLANGHDGGEGSEMYVNYIETSDLQARQVKSREFWAYLTPKTTNYTISINDYTIRASGNITITLPSASSSFDSGMVSGRILVIKNVGAGTVVVAGNIDGATDYSLASPNQSIMVQSNGSSWDILASHN